MNKIGMLSRFLPNQNKSNLQVDDLEAVLDLIPQAVFLINLEDLKILSANAHATEVTAFMRTELEGQLLSSILTPQDGDISFIDALRMTSPYGTEFNYLVKTRGGSKINVHASPLISSDGAWMIVVLQTERDHKNRINEQKRSHELWQHIRSLAEVMRSNDLDSALENVLKVACLLTHADAAAVYQADGDSPILNKTAFFGLDGILPNKTNPQDLISIQGQSIWNRRMHPATYLQSQARVNGLAYLACTTLGQEYARIGMFVIGGRNPQPANLSEILTSVGSFITTTIEIITKASYHQNQLAEKDFEISAANQIKDLIQDNLIFLGPDLEILDYNKPAEQALGYSLEEALNKPIDQIFICSVNLKPQFESALKGYHPTILQNTRLFRRNGQDFIARIRIEPCQITSHGPGVAILFQDMSEKENIRRQNEVLEQRAVLGEVTASFAHEVRNPINNISTGLQLLEFNLPPDDPNQDNIKRLRQDCDRLTALIKSGLSFIRHKEYQEKPVKLDNLLKNLLGTWRYRLERAQIKFQLQIEENLPEIEGDLRALEHVFTNLINNAFEAMISTEITSNRLLGVKVQRDKLSNGNGQIQVSISDTGVGIPEDIRERIFEPFFTTKDDGTGIGLAIVKRIVTAHRGSIHVESIPGGTIFQVQLPIMQDQTKLP